MAVERKSSRSLSSNCRWTKPSNPGASSRKMGADSLDVVELVMQFEEAFDLEISDEDAEKIKTVKDAIDYIEKNAKGSKYSLSNLPRRVRHHRLGLVCGVGNTAPEVWQQLLAAPVHGAHTGLRYTGFSVTLPRGQEF